MVFSFFYVSFLDIGLKLFNLGEKQILEVSLLDLKEKSILCLALGEKAVLGENKDSFLFKAGVAGV